MCRDFKHFAPWNEAVLKKIYPLFLATSSDYLLSGLVVKKTEVREAFRLAASNIPCYN